MYLIGLTGGIASGKSTVSGFFKDLGCHIIDADLIAREVVEPNKPAWRLILKHFGSGVLMADGTINRPKLGEIIFGDDKKRRLLNSCTHSYIQREMAYKVVMCLLKGYPYVVMDVPLLLEGGVIRRYVKHIVVVNCDQGTQLERLMSRNLTKDQALLRINSQMPLEKKVTLADFVIDNSHSVEDTRLAVERLHRHFNASYAHWKLRSLGVIVMLGFAYTIYYAVNVPL